MSGHKRETPDQIAILARKEHQTALAGYFGELSLLLAHEGLAGTLVHPGMQPLVRAVGRALDISIAPSPQTGTET